MMKNIKRIPKVSTTIAYIILLATCGLLLVGKSFMIFPQEISSHLTNLALGMMLYLIIGYIWLIFGIHFRFIALFGTFMILANIICETVVTFMNTPDIIDAIYGIIGIIIVFVFLYVIDRYGFIEVKKETKNPQ